MSDPKSDKSSNHSIPFNNNMRLKGMILLFLT